MFRASLEGMATFERVDVRTQPDEGLIEVTGYYHGKSTSYKVPDVEVGQLQVDKSVESEVTVTPNDDASWVCAVAEGNVLSLYANEPRDLDELGEDEHEEEGRTERDVRQ